MKVTFDEVGWMTLQCETPEDRDNLRTFVNRLVMNAGPVRYIMPVMTSGPSPHHHSLTINPTGEPA